MNPSNIIDFMAYHKRHESKQPPLETGPDTLAIAIQQLIQRLRDANPIQQQKSTLSASS
jgi:hypothetical protein